MFLRNTTDSKNALEVQVLKAATSVRSQKLFIDRIEMRISETNSLIAKYEEENLNIKISSAETEEQCERNDKLYAAKETEFIQQIAFINSLIDFASSSKNINTQVLLEQIVGLLLTLRPTSASSTNVLLESDFAEYQNLLDTKYISSVNQIETSLNRLISNLQNRQKTNEIDRESASTECKDELNALNFRLQQNENKTIEAHSTLQSLTEKQNENQQKLKIMESEFDILNKAFQNKALVISQVTEVSSTTQYTLEAEYSQLSTLLNEPLCCMCNQKSS